ncbi:MAG: hypothetical protein IPI77_16555 [Saprospiraceae bacterium]|nr:hypothetical protein [Saprospiraceae bacterium]
MQYREKWWIYGEKRPEFIQQLKKKKEFLLFARTSKTALFLFLQNKYLMQMYNNLF